MNSCLYDCRVFHRRLVPKRHEFVYRIFLFAIDLDELDELTREVPVFHHNESGLYAFRDDDHFQLVAGSARENAEHFLAARGCREKPARILLLTNTRFLGYIFNPISIWFCYRADGSPLCAIAEVGNTFGELKPYLVPWSGTGFRVRTPKLFYVSPFSDLDLEFDFSFEAPGERLGVWIDDYKANEQVLISSLTGCRVPFTLTRLLAFTARFPFITLQTIGLIHWQALRLWMRGLPFHKKETLPSLQQNVLRPHESLRGQTGIPIGQPRDP